MQGFQILSLHPDKLKKKILSKRTLLRAIPGCNNKQSISFLWHYIQMYKQIAAGAARDIQAPSSLWVRSWSAQSQLTVR